MLQQLEIFYETYLLEYDNYIADEIFCNDQTLASDGYKEISPQKGYGANKTYYAAYERLWPSSDSNGNVYPTLKCAINADNNFSRYTVNGKNVNGISTNGLLKYPVALLTADELVMAGTYKYIYNYDIYLVNPATTTNTWWTMTPTVFDGRAKAFNSSPTDDLIHFDFLENNYRIRPVINLKADVTVEDGTEGTAENPYVVKIN